MCVVGGGCFFQAEDGIRDESAVSAFLLNRSSDLLFPGPGKARSQQHQEKNQENPTSLGEAAML